MRVTKDIVGQLKATGSSSEPVEIPLSYGAILLRYVLVMALLYSAISLIWRGSSPWLYLFAIAAAVVTLQIGRYLVGRGPAIVMNAAGISIRRGIWFVTHLPWTEVTTFDLKFGAAGYYLVIGVKDPEGLRAKQNVYGRYAMGQREGMFGSPVCIPTFILKCDPKWLLQAANDSRARYAA